MEVDQLFSDPFSSKRNCQLISLAVSGSLFHVADKDFEIDEYVIPKGTEIYANIRGLMYDEKVENSPINRKHCFYFRMEHNVKHVLNLVTFVEIFHCYSFFLAELFRGMLFKWKGANKKSHQK